MYIKHTYCSEANASYMYIREDVKIASTDIVHTGDCMINLDKDVDGNVVGVEILHPDD